MTTPAYDAGGYGNPGPAPHTVATDPSRIDYYDIGSLTRPVVVGKIDTRPVGGNADQFGLGLGEEAGTGPRGGGGAQANTHIINETATPLQLFDKFTQWGVEDPQAAYDLKVKMYRAGFYGSVDPNDLGPTRGPVSTKDWKALKEALTGYYAYLDSKGADPNGSGENALDFFTWLSPTDDKGNPVYEGPAAGGGSGGQAAPAPQYTLDSARQTGDRYAHTELGHALTEGQAGTLQGAMNASMVSPSDAQVNDPEAFARDWVVQNNMGEYKARQASAYMNIFLNMLGGSGTAADLTPGDVAVG